MSENRTVANYMTKDLITFSPNQDIHQAVKTLVDNRISGGPVLDGDGNLIGILTKKDCLRVAYSAIYHGEWGGRVADHMTSEVKTLDTSLDIVEAAQMFLDHPYHRFPVMQDGNLKGLISRYDVLAALEDFWPE